MTSQLRITAGGSRFEVEATVADRLLDLRAQPSLIQRRNDQKTNKSLIVGGEILIEWLVIGYILTAASRGLFDQQSS
jgi:hypothetical protein